MDRPRHRLTDQAGFALVEVLVAAVLLIVMATATMATVETADSEAGKTQGRSIAVSLAASAQQKLRSMSAVTSLLDYDKTTTSSVANRTYTVRSQVTPIRDGSDALSCTTDTSGVSYLRTQTTVSWNGPGSPLTNTSLVTPSENAVGVSYGALSAKVVDGDNNPVTSASVSAGGRQKAVNALGCAVFENLPAGPTAVSVGRITGYVQPNGWKLTDPTTPPSSTATIVGRGTDNETYRYAPGRAAAIQVVRSQRIASPNETTTTPVPVTITHTDGDFGGPRVATPTGSSSPYAVGGLFPFSTAYGVYAGTCAANNPTTSPNAGTLATANLASSQTVIATTKVYLPVMALTVKLDGSTSTASSYRARVVLTAADAGCSGSYTGSVDSNGRVQIAAPFGKYAICVDSTVANSRTGGTQQYVTNYVQAGAAAYTDYNFASNQAVTGAQCPT